MFSTVPIACIKYPFYKLKIFIGLHKIRLNGDFTGMNPEFLMREGHLY